MALLAFKKTEDGSAVICSLRVELDGQLREGKAHRRSLHYATPDFLSKLVALPNFMRLSLLKAAHVAVAECCAAGIRVRSGRDDKV
jgi:hypothetical protein